MRIKSKKGRVLVRKNNAILISIIILAVIIGVFGQDFAYFLNWISDDLEPVYNLTVLTVISVSLFLIAILMTCFQYIRGKIGTKQLGLFMFLSLIVGLVISGWSIFVLAMWWG